MSATIYSLPPVIALSQEPMLVTIATNNVTSARARLDITVVMASSGPAIDQTWTLGWAGKYISLIFKGNPNNSGTELPICDPILGVTKRYIRELAEALMRHEWISEEFEVIINDTTDIISLQSRHDVPLSIVSISPVSNLTTLITNATSPYLEPNLSALLKVISRKGREIAKLSGSYAIKKGKLTPFEGRSTFDIGRLFDLSPHLPSTKTLNPAVIFQNAIAFRAYTQYFLRYADKFGTPPIAEALFRTTPMFAIYGGRSIHTTATFAANTKGFLLNHSPQAKTLTRHQPAWLYCFTTKQYDRAVASVRLWCSDGASYTAWVGTPHHIKANKLYYYRTGFELLSLENVANLFNISTKLIGYEWQLIDELTNEVYLSQRYNFEDCRFDSLYIAYANGLGGIDTLHLRGGIKKSEAERTIIQYADKSLASTEVTTQQIWEVQTGLVTPQYADSLRQILVGETWLIDTKNTRFLKLILDTKSIETQPRGTGMVALSFSFKSAWIDRNTV